MLNNILYRFSDGWDIITLGQVTPTLYMLSEDRQLWKKLCQYHFAEKQVRELHWFLCEKILKLGRNTAEHKRKGLLKQCDPVGQTHSCPGTGESMSKLLLSIFMQCFSTMTKMAGYIAE